MTEYLEEIIMDKKKSTQINFGDKPGNEIVEKREETDIIPKNTIEIKNLIVSQTPLRKVILGTVDGIVDITKRNEDNVSAIIWNEEQISLFLKESDAEIRFTPEFHPSTQMFFSREEKRNRDMWDDNAGMRIWEGEYEPIQFQKNQLIKFLNKYSSFFEPEVEQAIKNLKVTRKQSSQAEMLDLADDNERTIEETTQSTNLPSVFKAKMPLFDNFFVDLEFEAKVVKKKDRYGSEQSKQVIELRCTNARESLREVMYEILEKFSKDIPKYYGELGFRPKGKLF